MSLTMALTRTLLHCLPRGTGTADAIHARVQDRKPAAAIPADLLRVAHVQESVVAGCRVVRLVPKTGASGTTVIYIPGGAYVGAILGVHWRMLATLIRTTGATFVVTLYGLAPEHTAVDAYALLDAVYAEVDAAQAGPLFLAGDSAGGALALGMAQRLRDAGAPPPTGVILISPWLDATMANPDVPALAGRDPMLGAAGLIEAGKMWAGELDPRSPLVSPLFGDLANLPPVVTYQGGRDLFAPDAKVLTRRIVSAGGTALLYFFPTAFHVFPAAPWTPEARRALKSMGQVIRQE